jgi:hypothetical protein
MGVHWLWSPSSSSTHASQQVPERRQLASLVEYSVYITQCRVCKSRASRGCSEHLIQERVEGDAEAIKYSREQRPSVREDKRLRMQQWYLQRSAAGGHSFGRDGQDGEGKVITNSSRCVVCTGCVCVCVCVCVSEHVAVRVDITVLRRLCAGRFMMPTQQYDNGYVRVHSVHGS